MGEQVEDNKQKVSEVFTKGLQVEVSSNEEELNGAWFVATVLKPPSSTGKRKGKAFVEYQSLLSDDELKPLTEYVDESCMRPLPPDQATDRSFEMYDVVDAFYYDAWWKGVISRVTVLSETKVYTVVFQNPLDQMDFRSSDLRFHWDWSNGKWVRPPKQKRMEGFKFIKGMEVEVNSIKDYTNDDWFPATVLDEVGFNAFLVKCNGLRNDNQSALTTLTVDSLHIRPSPPSYRPKNFVIMETVDAFCGSCWRVGSITKILIEGKYIVFLKYAQEEKEFSQSEIRPRIYFINGNWVNEIKDMIAYSQEHSGHASSTNAESPEITSKCTKAKQSAVKKAKRCAFNSEATILRFSKRFKKEVTANSLSSQQCRIELVPIDSPNWKTKVICDKVTKCSNHPKACNKNSAGKSPFRGGNFDIVEISQEKAGFETPACIKGWLGPAAGELANTKRDSPGDIVDMDHITIEVDLSGAVAEWIGDTHLEKSCDLSGEEINKHNEEGEEHNGASQMDFEDCATEKVEFSTVTSVKPAETSAMVSSNDYLEDEVNLVVAGASCGRPSEGPCASLCIEGNGQVETATHSLVGNVSENHELVEHHGLFVKRSSVWEHVESLEVFQSMPQRPHFHPLAKRTELGREGMAIGLMVTFATVVEQASKSKVDDPRDIFVSFLEALDDLELHGFDVKATVDRVTKMLSIKDGLGQLQDQSKEVQVQIACHNNEETKLAEDEAAIEKMINELKEKRSLIKSLKENQKSKITALQMHSGVITAEILKEEHEFESVVTGIF